MNESMCLYVYVCVCLVPPKVLLDSANQAVSLSDRVLMDCPISDADPPPVILWTKNDQPLDFNGRVQQLNNGSLAIYDSAVSLHHHQHHHHHHHHHHLFKG